MRRLCLGMVFPGLRDNSSEQEHPSQHWVRCRATGLLQNLLGFIQIGLIDVNARHQGARLARWRVGVSILLQHSERPEVVVVGQIGLCAGQHQVRFRSTAPGWSMDMTYNLTVVDDDD